MDSLHTIFSVSHSYEVHIIFCLLPLASCLLPLAFPSWEGLGVGSSCLLPLASCLLPAPCSLLPAP
ncbi:MULTISPECIES: hypothetical protein [unclassified Moorena]|uniref:hypothetical protein n=1 Tax=unclassified Moorena TaxID=2683338 RepID=UPI0014009951|nr:MULTISPECIES: hypothetical protein [unclassified Moorena]NEO11566.1 hypothetical protein [Moorena sp. SIO3E8]NEP99696.1 hypothetical protein [Moorena sp. SIO3F7]